MKTIDRRTVLRGLLGGAAVSVALPTLEVMLDQHGEALAGGAPLPDRFGVWFWGNGVRPERWVPTTTGDAWTPNDETEPLLDVRDYVSIASGFDIKTSSYPHHSGVAGVLTGKHYRQLGTTRDTIVSTFDGPSVDVLAADAMDGLAPFRSLELGVTTFRGTDEGSTFQHLSHNGPNAPNPAEYDPVALWQRLFADRDADRDYVRTSVLDAVSAQTARLERRLGAADKQRLDLHLTSVRELERRLASAAGSCEPVPEPDRPLEVPGQEPIVQKNTLISELLALALACDQTRVFSVLFSTAGSSMVWWQAGTRDGMHWLCHTEPMPQPFVHEGSRLTMIQLATFLRTLRDTPDGAGNLLDICSILCTTELADGRTHDNFDLPLILAGKGNGRLVGGRHHRSTSADNASRVVLTALHGAGLTLPSFGDGAGYADQVVAELMT